MELVLIVILVFMLALYVLLKDRRTFKSIDKRLARIESQLGIKNAS